MNKGVSLISLIITIVVIIILAGLTVFNSFSTVEQAQEVKLEEEFNRVSDYVRTISTKAEAGLIELNGLTDDTIATVAELSSFYVESGEFTSNEQQNIQGINESGKAAKYCYHYITGKEIENGIPGLEEFPSNLDEVNNNYIINFYYGTIIAKISPTKSCITGKVR